MPLELEDEVELDDEGRIRIRSGNQYPMPAVIPGGFSPKQIVYRELSAKSPPFEWYYVDIDIPTEIGATTPTIEQFVRNIATSAYVRNAGDNEEAKKIDIPITDDSYVILQLAPETELVFGDTRQFPAVTLGTRSSSPPNNKYGGLCYVDARGNTHSSPISNSKIVYFCALFQGGTVTNPHKQSLNYNVKDRHGTATVADPDIRYPGVGQ
jgi:hypothetical protein